MAFSKENGLRQLKQRLDEAGGVSEEFYALEYRLRENLEREARLGTTEMIRSEQVAVVQELNSFALKTVGVSFNDLCDMASPSLARRKTVVKRIAITSIVFTLVAMAVLLIDGALRLLKIFDVSIAIPMIIIGVFYLVALVLETFFVPTKP